MNPDQLCQVLHYLVLVIAAAAAVVFVVMVVVIPIILIIILDLLIRAVTIKSNIAVLENFVIFVYHWLAELCRKITG